MPEAIKEIIVKALKELNGERVNIKQLHQLIGKYSYPTILKWVTVLHGEGIIKVEDYGKVKIISLYDYGSENG